VDSIDWLIKYVCRIGKTYRGWTQKDLADKLGVKQSTVAKWKTRGLYIAKKPDMILERFSV
jgi:transcriptional regulator with XRE-family HTH domain